MSLEAYHNNSAQEDLMWKLTKLTKKICSQNYLQTIIVILLEL